MHPPLRDQSELDTVNVYVDASDGPDNKDVARQEYKNEADIGYMLSRFGVIPPRGAPQYGEWDDSLDLQMAIESVREAQLAYGNLPKELREKFHNMGDLLNAIENGSLVIKDEPAPEPPPQPLPDPLRAELDAIKKHINFTTPPTTE